MNGSKLKKNRIGKMEFAIVFLCCLLPVIDTFNGYFSGNIPIGSTYKLVILLFLLFSVIIKNVRISKNNAFLTLFILVYIFLSILINVGFLGGKVLSVDFPIKLIFNILFFVLLFQCTQNGMLLGSTFYKILDYSSWIFICCFLVPYIMGVGNRIYAGDIGYKAFFISQNEMSFVLIVLCFFSAYKMLKKISLRNSIQLILLVMCGILCNTKSTLFACVSIVVIMFLIKINKSTTKGKLYVLGVVTIGFILLKKQIVVSISSMLYRFNSLKSIHYGNSILTSILSGRDLYLKEEWNNLFATNSIIKFIFGNGFCSKRLIEMDFFDIFFFLGIIGIIGMIYFLSYLFRRTLINTKIDTNFFRLLSLIVLILFMFFTGHVIFMAMSGSYFVIYCCFLIFYTDKEYV